MHDTTAHDQQYESNPRPFSLELNALSTRLHAPTIVLDFSLVTFVLNANDSIHMFQFSKQTVIESYVSFIENFPKAEKVLDDLGTKTSFQKFIDVSINFVYDSCMLRG